ncbi:MAG: tRNA 2-thiocytidine(32) synthetase TtcA [Candidatus Delongbacteria bacterium]|jgi:tRNA 2-thiocytidine biosynthesis protein TtcA|nr:tRNA 2-thiocytidine(32) synthetase TtcA [Candidatus Delongbacteria bacterium]
MNKKEKKFLQQFHARAGACIREHNMIEDGDRLMVGVSGGKDSLALLKTLAGRKNFSEKHYTLIAVFVDIIEIPYKTDVLWLRNFCKTLDVPLHVKQISVNFSKTNKSSTCFYCAWHRRKTLFEFGKKKDVNKIALGHHRGDALETMMLNMVSHGTLSSMPGNLPMFGGRVNLIRPLLNHTDDQTTEFARLMDFPLTNKPCPYEDNTRRIQIGEMLHAIEEQFPGARKNMFKSMSQIYLDYLPIADPDSAVIRDDRVREKNR